MPFARGAALAGDISGQCGHGHMDVHFSQWGFSGRFEHGCPFWLEGPLQPIWTWMSILARGASPADLDMDLYFCQGAALAVDMDGCPFRSGPLQPIWTWRGLPGRFAHGCPFWQEGPRLSGRFGHGCAFRPEGLSSRFGHGCPFWPERILQSMCRKVSLQRRRTVILKRYVATPTPPSLWSGGKVKISREHQQRTHQQRNHQGGQSKRAPPPQTSLSANDWSRL